jgi:hypothetical protein
LFLIFLLQKSYLLESSESRPLIPMVDTSDNTVKVLNAQHSHAHQNHNLGRSIVLKRSRHYYGHQYSRRNLGSHADASTSHGKTALSRNERLTFKLISQPGSKPGCHTGEIFVVAWCWRQCFSLPHGNNLASSCFIHACIQMGHLNNFYIISENIRGCIIFYKFRAKILMHTRWKSFSMHL